MSIEQCHPLGHNLDDDDDTGEEEVLDPYFADPNDRMGARITQFQVCGELAFAQLLAPSLNDL